MSAHTPGPWSASEHAKRWYVEDSGGNVVARIEHWSNEVDPHDARLIAAAPDTYEALVMVRDADDDCRRDCLPTLPAAARARIDAAIAKAEGLV